MLSYKTFRRLWAPPFNHVELPQWSGTICLGNLPLGPLNAGHKEKAVPLQFCDKAHTKGAYRAGPVTRPAYVCCTCRRTARHALATRHAGTQHPMTSALAYARALVERDGASIANRARYIVDREGWLARFPAHKRLKLARSWLVESPQPHKGKTMVKLEAGTKPPHKARLIQFLHNDATQDVYGPEFYAVQKALGEYYDGKLRDGVSLTMACGMNTDGIGSWLETAMESYAHPVFYWQDYENFDANCRDEHFYLARAVYRHMPKGFYNFTQALRSTTQVMRTSDGPYVYTSKTGVKSGHQDTSSMNTHINLLVAYDAARSIGVKCHIIAMGDDLLLVAESGFDAKRFSSACSAAGYGVKCGVVETPCEVEFLGGTFVPKRGGGYKLVPRPARIAAKLFWTVKPPARRREAAYRAGVLAGLDPLMRGEVLYEKMYQDIPRQNPMATDKYQVIWSTGREDLDWHRFYLLRYGLLPVLVENCNPNDPNDTVYQLMFDRDQ